MIILSVTVIFQRRKAEKGRMKEKWQEMKEKDGQRADYY